LLFLAGASGAATGTAYMAGAFDPYPQPAAVAALPSTGGQADPAKPPAADAPKPADAAAEPAKPQEQKIAAINPQPEKSKPDVATPGPVPPTFDLLRVEPDGSIVIAGKATSGATVEVVTGSKTLATVEAGPGAISLRCWMSR
jgi:hypothetical protein